MSENPEQKEFIHWQDLAEQLGANTSQEIDDYFGGTTTFADVELDETDLPDSLPKMVAPAAASLQNETMKNTETDNMKPEQSHGSDADENMADADSKTDEQPVAATESDLEIGWTAPPSAAPTPRKSKEKPARKKKRTTPGPISTEDKPAPQAAAPVAETGHWNDLASTLGLAASAAPVDSSGSKPNRKEETKSADDSNSEKNQEEDEEEEVLTFELLDDAGDEELTTAILVEGPPSEDEVEARIVEPSRGDKSSRSDRSRKGRSEKARGSRSEKPPAKPAPPAASSGFGAGLIDFGEVEKSSDEITQENILGEMFAANDEEEFDSDAEVAEEDEGAFVERTFDGDDEYVEFEVEDLDPSGRRPRGRKRPARGRDDRPVAEEVGDEDAGEGRGRRNKPERSGRSERGGRGDRDGRNSGEGRREKSGRGEREGRGEKSGRGERSEQSGRGDREGRGEKQGRRRKKTRSAENDVVENENDAIVARSNEDNDRPRRKRKRRSERSNRKERSENVDAVEVADLDDEAVDEIDGFDNDEQEVEQRPKRRRRKRSQGKRQGSEAKGRDADDVNEMDDDADDSDERPARSRQGRGRKKPSEAAKKLPTWDDTINVVVDGNINSRDKKPQRKKRVGGGGGGRSRRGGGGNQGRGQKRGRRD